MAKFPSSNLIDAILRIAKIENPRTGHPIYQSPNWRHGFEFKYLWLALGGHITSVAK
jgi:hypothetical protein